MSDGALGGKVVVFVSLFVGILPDISAAALMLELKDAIHSLWTYSMI